MKMKTMRLLPAILALYLCTTASVKAAAQVNLEEEQAAAYLREQGIMVGYENGEMGLESSLTRAHLAAVLTRLNEKSELSQNQQTYYAEQCNFSDVPEWARHYVGYCFAKGLMIGYGNGTFGAYDSVTPQAACTVVLRYLGPDDTVWDYSTACQTALDLGLTTPDATTGEEITRGELAVMLYRTLISGGEGTQEAGGGVLESIGSYKGTVLSIGDRSGLIVVDSNEVCSVVSSNPNVLAVEQVSDHWVAVAVSAGTATITATATDGSSASLTFTVTPAGTGVADTNSVPDINANAEIRNTIVSLINQVRREYGVPELAVNQALMDAAQDCASHHFTTHDKKYECETAIRYGYSHGFGSNLTWFSGASRVDVAQVAVNNWVNSPGHLQTMTTARYEDLGVGVSIQNGIAYCYMFAGDPDSYNAYS